jgi:hypothetical protein
VDIWEGKKVGGSYYRAKKALDELDKNPQPLRLFSTDPSSGESSGSARQYFLEYLFLQVGVDLRTEESCKRQLEIQQRKDGHKSTLSISTSTPTPTPTSMKSNPRSGRRKRVIPDSEDDEDDEDLYEDDEEEDENDESNHEDDDHDHDDDTNRPTSRDLKPPSKRPRTANVSDNDNLEVIVSILVNLITISSQHHGRDWEMA